MIYGNFFRMEKNLPEISPGDMEEKIKSLLKPIISIKTKKPWIGILPCTCLLLIITQNNREFSGLSSTRIKILKKYSWMIFGECGICRKLKMQRPIFIQKKTTPILLICIYPGILQRKFV